MEERKREEWKCELLSAVTIEAMVEVRVTYWVDCIFHR
jgi:hypothetical protein